MTPLLEAKSVSKNFGEFRALHDVSIAVNADEFVSVVGPNGAGKTTLVNVLTGLLLPSEGQVFFKGENISGVGPIALAKRGMARTFQLVQIFPQLTVAETIAAAVVSQQQKQWQLLPALSHDTALGQRVREIADIFGMSGQVGKRLTHALARREKTTGRGIRLRPRTPRSSCSTSRPRAFRRPRSTALMQTLIAAARLGRRARPSSWSSTIWTWWPSYSQRISRPCRRARVLADLPPGPFFSDPHIVATVVGKRNRH